MVFLRLRVGNVAVGCVSIGSVLAALLTTIWIGLPLATTHGAGLSPGPHPVPAVVPGSDRLTWGPTCQPTAANPGSRVDRVAMHDPDPATIGILAVSIAAPTVVADVGDQIHLQGVGSGGVPPYKFAWNDTLGSNWGGSTYSLQSPIPANVTVTLVAIDQAGDVANASLRLRFVPLPSLVVTDAPPSVDEATPFEVNLSVAGGVVPDRLQWEVAGGGSGSATFCVAGTFPESLLANRTGPVVVTLNGTDADGNAFARTVTVATAYADPVLAAQAPSGEIEGAAPFALPLSVSGGAPPREWTLVSTLAFATRPATDGVVPQTGWFNWSARLLGAQNGTIVVTVRDAVGTLVRTNLSVNVTPELALGLSASATTAPVGENFTLSAEVGGGVAPYGVAFLIDGVPLENTTVAASGRVTWNFSPTVAGTFVVSARVQDAAGATAVGSITVVSTVPIPANRSDPPLAAPVGPSTTPGWIAWPIGLGLFGLVATLFVWPRWRRRRKGDDEDDPGEAPEVVRRLLEEGGGIDREALYFRAEAEGLGRSAISAALDAWRREGRVTARPGLDGEELLGWTNATPTRAVNGEGNP